MSCPSSERIKRYVSVTLYTPPSQPNRWKSYASTFLRRLDASSVPPGWTLLMFLADCVTDRFVQQVRSRVEDVEVRRISPDNPLAAMPACWRFLAHDEPDAEVYYCMDVDSAFYKRDLTSIAMLDANPVLDGVIGRPNWYLDDTGEVSRIDAGGFGLRPSRFSFRMSHLLTHYAERQSSKEACRLYFFDEKFLHHVLEPILTAHTGGALVEVKRTNTGANAKTVKPLAKYVALL